MIIRRMARILLQFVIKPDMKCWGEMFICKAWIIYISGRYVMDFYHGTIVGGLTELRPFISANLKEPYVYLTISKQLATHYILDRKNRINSSPMLDIRKDGVMIFQEMFSGALEYIYKGLSGYIYHCVGNYPLNNEAKVNTCATSDQPVPIANVEFVEDVYERILEYGRYGTFIYEKYEELPRYRHDIIRGHVIRGVKDRNLIENPESPDSLFHQEKYPQYWKEAEVLYKHGLL